MLFEPIYNTELFKYINWKQLSSNKSFDLIIDIILYRTNIDIHSKIEILDKLDWAQLSENYGAINFLKKYERKINWNYFSENSHDDAINMLFENKRRINYSMFSRNNNDRAIMYFKLHKEKIDWNHFIFNTNPQAIIMIKHNIENINIKNLSMNWNAIDIIKEYPDLINWENLSYECRDIEFMKKNRDKLQLHMLHSNEYAYELLTPENIVMDWIFDNPKAYDLIKKHVKEYELTEQDMEYLCTNKNALDILFPLKYSEMRDKMKDFKEELCSYVFNPVRMNKIAKSYNLSLEELQDYY
jgi:hypothetical protein